MSPNAMGAAIQVFMVLRLQILVGGAVGHGYRPIRRDSLLSRTYRAGQSRHARLGWTTVSVSGLRIDSGRSTVSSVSPSVHGVSVRERRRLL